MTKEINRESFQFKLGSGEVKLISDMTIDEIGAKVGAQVAICLSMVSLFLCSFVETRQYTASFKVFIIENLLRRCFYRFAQLNEQRTFQGQKNHFGRRFAALDQKFYR